MTEDLDRRLVYSVAEVAALLGLSAPTVYDLVRDGQLRSVRLGRKYAIPKSVLDEFLAGEMKEEKARKR